MDTNNSSGDKKTLPDWVTPGWLLGAFSLVFIFALSLTYELTHEKIAEQERLRLVSQLQELLPPGGYDNSPDEDVKVYEQNGRTVYRARKGDSPVAALIRTIAPNGYSGSIHLLVGVKPDGTLLGVRVIKHQETPGLGDAIELRRSDWVLDFNNRSLTNPTVDQWAVTKDGGVFDAFTGATITPRAVVGEIKSTLEFFQQHQQEIFQ